MGRLRQSQGRQSDGRSGLTAAGGAVQSISSGTMPINPFLSHDFLSALEASKSVGSHSGWHVQHLLVQTADGTLVAAAPCYLKSHSRGEYVFDRGWAEAYAQAGGSYYPKLQVAVPFTPATGRRLLVRPGPNAEQVRKTLASGLIGALPHRRRFRRTRHLRHRSRIPFPRRTRIPPTDGPAIPLGKCRLFHVRRFPHCARCAQAQDHPPRTPRCASQRYQRALADRQRPHRGRMGSLLRVLHGDRFAQMGPALSDPAILFAHRPEPWATTSCW